MATPRCADRRTLPGDRHPCIDGLFHSVSTKSPRQRDQTPSPTSRRRPRSIRIVIGESRSPITDSQRASRPVSSTSVAGKSSMEVIVTLPNPHRGLRTASAQLPLHFYRVNRSVSDDKYLNRDDVVHPSPSMRITVWEPDRGVNPTGLAAGPHACRRQGGHTETRRVRGLYQALYK